LFFPFRKAIQQALDSLPEVEAVQKSSSNNEHGPEPKPAPKFSAALLPKAVQDAITQIEDAL